MSSTAEPVTLVEIDLPVCTHTYSVAPCTASLGVTGDIKCFNSIRTCQDRENFEQTILTLRLAKAYPGVAAQYAAIPNVRNVQISPAELDPGNGMGVRGSVTLVCDDHPHGDGIFDKYIADRGYDPYSQGTFWPKFRARFPSIVGQPLRVLRGFVGDALEDFTVDHFFCSGFALDPAGVKITAKDSLSFCDPKKAQCPLPSTGTLLADVATGDSSFTLAPSGIGDDEYPASGYLCLSNKEIISFTRSGDAVTITGRNLFGSELVDHDADSVVQVVKTYTNESVADIIYDLLANFTPGIDASWMDLPAWQAEAEAYIGHAYTAQIPAPTSVMTLINELCAQAGVTLWGDTERNTIEFRTLRPVTPGALRYTDASILQKSFKTQDQPDTRISLAVTYFGVANACEKVDKEKNFRMTDIAVDAEADQDYNGIAAVKKNFSRWIPAGNRPAAARLNNMQLSRFRDPPRRLALDLFATHPSLPLLGDGIFIQSACIQDTQGAPEEIPAIITSKTRNEDGNNYEAQELHFADSLVPGSDRTVFIETDSFNINLRALYDALYTSVPSEASITFFIKAGTWVGGSDPSVPSVTVGDWPEAPELILVIGSDGGASSKLLGGGGRGGFDGGSPQDGGTALYTRVAITIQNFGVIGAGGGGGQDNTGFNTGTSTYFSAGGGGGAGFNGYNDLGARRGGAGGTGTDLGGDGTDTTGGEGVVAPDGFIGANHSGQGGDLAMPGWTNDAGGPPDDSATDPGVAIDGVSFVTFDVTGSVVGDQIN